MNTFKTWNGERNTMSVENFDKCWLRIVGQVREIMDAIPGGTWRD